MKIRLFFSKFSLPLAAFLLLSIAVLPSSSGADDALFVRAQGEIERLWSGVLGCAESGSSFTIQNRFNGSESTYGGGGGSLPAEGSSDYSECGKRALRNTGSRILVDTIEDALRQGGLALFDEGFQLDSSLSWVSEESTDVTLQGEIDLTLPFYSENGHVIFTQPGLIFWKGQEEEDRVDGNFGVVYRTNLENTPIGIDAIGGASLFYDWDFHRVGHSRLGIGADIQSGHLHGAFNYYHPLSGERDGQREGFIEEALRGMDARLAFERDTVRAGARLGYWRYDGGEDVTDEWKASIGFDAGFRIAPGVFVEAEWEKHQEDVILDQRLSLGMAFRFSLPDFEGQSYGNGGMSTNLYKIVEREKRILYEEREDVVPRIQLTLQGGSQGGSSVAEGDTLIISGELVELAVPVVLDLVIDEDASSAELGSDKDFTYGYKVYEPDAGNGGQSAPDDATNCPNTTCEMVIPAGVTKFDIEMDILEDSDDKEVPEEIVLQVDVPEEYQRMIRGAEATVTIRAHGNEIGFATDAVTTLAEDNETEGVEVSVSVDKPSPTPITLNVALSGTAAEGRNGDYMISTRSLVIPANASSASLRLYGIDNDEGGGNKSIILTISGNLPEGWVITDDEHEVTLSDNDSAVFFTSATPRRVEEPDSGNESVTVAVGISQAPTADITVRIAPETGGTNYAEEGTGKDYTFEGENVTFTLTDHADKTFTFNVHSDNDPEPDEFIVLMLSEVGGSLQGSGFSLGGNHTITIPANGNTVGFVSGTADTLDENGGTANVEVSISNPAPADITLNVATSGEAMEGANRDYTISTRSLTIRAGQTTGTITLTGINDFVGEGNEDIDLTLSVVGNLPDGWIQGDLEHEVTLLDDDLVVFFTSATRSRVEEPASDQSVTIEVGITQAPMAEIKVMLAADTSASSAEQGTGKDYTFTDIELTFPVSSTASQTAALMVLHDTVAENDETIVLTLSEVGGSLTAGGNNFSLGDNHTITIPANDRFIRFASSSATMLNEADGMAASVMVEVVPPASENITLSIATSGQAVEGEDYTISTKSLTIDAGQSNGTIMLTGINDLSGEGDETIQLTLGASGTLPPGYTVDATPHELTLIDDDFNVGFTAEAVSVFEPGDGGGGSHMAMVALTQTPAENVSLTITPSGTATSGDYTLSTTMVRFAAGATDDDLVQPVTITINPDDVSEGDETVVLTLADQGGSLRNGENDFKIGRGTFTLTIPTNDNLVQFTEITGQGNLGEADGTRTRNLRVSIVDNPLPENANINIKTGGTATEGEDYNITVASPATASYASGVLTIPANEGQIDLTLTVIDDPADDWGVPRAGTGNTFFDDETIELTLEDPNGNLPTGSAINADKSTENLTIIDNDTGLFFFNRNPTTTEGPFGIANAAIVFSSLLAENVTIPLTVTGDSDAFELSVTVNRQKQIVTDQMVLPAGLRNVQLRVNTKDDSDNHNEIVTVTIDKENLPPNFGTNEDNVWELEIRDKDARTVLFSNTVSTVTEGGSVSIDLQMSPPLAEDVTIPLTRISGDGDAYSLDASAPSSASVTRDGAVHMVNFIQNENPNSVTLSFTAEEDDDRFDDTVILSMNEDDFPEGYNASRVGSRFGWRVSVTDNDKRIVSFADTSASVGEGGTVTTQIRVSEALTENVSIPLSITGNPDVYRITATAPAGASYSNGMVHFAQSEDAESVTLQFEAREDLNGSSETITVAVDEDNLPGDYAIGASGSTWEVSIADDDMRAVSFRFTNSSPANGANIPIYEGDNYTNLQLHVSPPLDVGQNAIIPLRITGDVDAYHLSRSAPNGAGIDRGGSPQGTSRDQRTRVHFAQSEDAESVTFNFWARRDIDHDKDRVRVAIDVDNLPDGFYIGSNPFVNFDVFDYRQTVIELFVLEHPNALPDENGVITLNKNSGDVVNLRVRARPAGLHIYSRVPYSDSNFVSPLSGDNVVDGRAGTARVVLENIRLQGAVRLVSNGEFFGLSRLPSVGVSEIPFEITMRGIDNTTYSIWIVEAPSGTVIGDARRVHFNICRRGIGAGC